MNAFDDLAFGELVVASHYLEVDIMVNQAT